jgi:hypothetical protein
MSVRTGDRGEGKLQVLNVARELKQYSLDRVRAEKEFPKSTRWLYANPIATHVRGACACIRYANSIYVNMTEEYVERRIAQDRAYGHLEALFDLIEDAMLAGYISGERADIWSGKVDDTEVLLRKWMKSDREKYRQFAPANENHRVEL